jgi:RNA polymerase sigma-70 factor (ECF subfamily)
LHTEADIATIAASQQGDARACREIYEIYKDRVFALCRRMSPSEADAEDLAQEVFISAFRSIGAFRMESALGTWIYRIALNRCHRARSRFGPAEASFDAMAEMGAAPASRAPGPDDRLLRKELRERTDAAIAGLPDALRAIFVLGTVEGMAYAEIAKIVACSEDAVKMRMHRARKRVKDALTPYLRT